MPSETLHFENARFAQQLFHNDPRNLMALETQLGVKAPTRDAWIKLEGIPVVEFTRRDIVRHPLVQRIIVAYEEHRGRAMNG